MLVGFKDSGGGFYQAEIENEGDTPAWAVGMTRLTTEQSLAELAASLPDPADVVKWQIDSIERDTLMNRAAREGLLLLTEKEAMREYSVDQATAQAGLYAGNLAYRKVKDVDNQIAALRAQIGAL